MDFFMNMMAWVTKYGMHKGILFLGLVLLLLGLFRTFGLKLKGLGESAKSALWLIILVIVLMWVAPVHTAANWLAQSIPFVGDMMDYGSIIILIENKPWDALVNFVDCYLLMVMSEVLGKLFFKVANWVVRIMTGWGDEDLLANVKSIVTKILLEMVFMIACILLLEKFKSWEGYDKIDEILYIGTGIVLGIGVIGLISTSLFGGGVLPPIMMLIPGVLVKPLFSTTLYIVLLFTLGMCEFDLSGAAEGVVGIVGAFAPAAIVIISLIILIIGILKMV